MPTDPVEAANAPSSWLGEIWKGAIGQLGARLGLAWIVFVGFCAIFAPFLANSHPYLIKMDGHWSSPLLKTLTPADVLLLLLTAAGIVLWFTKQRFATKLGGLLWVFLIGWPLTLWKPAWNWMHASGGSPQQRGTFLGIILLIDLVFAVIVLMRLSMSARSKTIMALFMLLVAAGLILWPVNPPQLVVYEQYRTAAAEGRVQWVLNAPVPYSVGDHLRDQFDPGHPHPWGPSWQHPMGTEIYGADILSHMIHACRVAMAVGFISTGLSVGIGIFIGALLGYFVGLVDLLGMRVIEVFGAIPTIYLLLTFVAAFPQYRSIYLIMAIIGLTSWVGDARFVRAEFFKLRHQDFVQAAVAEGLPLRSILFKHLLPNAIAPLLVSASFGIAGAILSESILSFLGLGIPIGQASWGQLLNEATSDSGAFFWWLGTFPGIAIFLTVLAYNVIGEALRDALDPKLRG
jgi:peptide/nickel transport system permease protein